jgi:hypothetical protein
VLQRVPLCDVSQSDLLALGRLAHSHVLMFVTMMQVRVMRMFVQDPRVKVPVAMGFSCRISWRMSVLVMDVVQVTMFVLEWFMQVLVVMHLGEVQINTNPHEQCRTD